MVLPRAVLPFVGDALRLARLARVMRSFRRIPQGIALMEFLIFLAVAVAVVAVYRKVRPLLQSAGIVR